MLGQIELHLTARARAAATEADAALDAAVRELQDALGRRVYSVDGRRARGGRRRPAARAQLTIAVAESCTGGLLASRLTDVPGSSDYVERGVVCYSNRAKIEWLGVPEALIAEHGAVSEPVARAMADGIRIARRHQRRRSASPASPDPAAARPTKPVGTVAIAVVAGDDASRPHVSVRRRPRAW